MARIIHGIQRIYQRSCPRIRILRVRGVHHRDACLCWRQETVPCSVCSHSYTQCLTQHAAPHRAASFTILHVPSVKQSYHRDTAAVRGGQARGEDVSRVQSLQSDVWTGVIRDIMQGSTLASVNQCREEREKTTSPCDRISIIMVPRYCQDIGRTQNPV